MRDGRRDADDDAVRAKRWREIDRVMSEDASWRSGVQSLALELHEAAARLSPPQLRIYADEVTGRLFQSLLDKATENGFALTEAQADDFVSALFSSALTLADTFPACVGLAS